MNGVSETSSTLCNNGCENTKNSLDNNKNYSKYHQITTAQNELISIQRSLIRELLKYSKEFQERFDNNYYNANDNNNQEQQMEYDTMQTDVESIRNEISFVKSIKDVIKGDNGNGTVTKNKRKASLTMQSKNTGFLYLENSSQNNHFSQNNENDNTVNTTNSSNDFSYVNEFPRDRDDFEQNYEDSQMTSTSFPSFPMNNDYSRNYNETNETNESNEPNETNGTNENNEDCFGEFKGFNSVYLGGINETIDVQLLQQCLEESLGPVRFIRIIRNKGCAFAEFEEKSCFAAALKLGSVSLNGVNLKINKTFRKQKKLENASDERQQF